MIKEIASAARPILELPMVRRTRRNHGLEHATIHILSRRMKKLRMAGRSDSGGFILIGDAPTEAIESAAREALRRMKAGDHELAIHPNCGTNLVTTASLATGAAMLGLAGASRKAAWNTFNEGSPCYRIRPRYNSEYMWNKPSLEGLKPISGMAPNYQTSIPWFAYPGAMPQN